MKKIACMISSALLLGALAVSAAKTVPYSSQFYTPYNLDEGWTNYNGARGAKGWQADTNWTSAEEFAVAGVTGGAIKQYDNGSAADAWLFSPAITVHAGVEYTVTIWARTDFNPVWDEHESFKITVGNEAAKAAQTTIIIDRPSYQNGGNFEMITATFTPSVSGDVYFGVNCYSAIDQDTLYLTGFSITGEDGGGEDPEQPGENPEGQALPYSFDFSSSATFNSDWRSLAGPNAYSQSPWTVYISDWSASYAEFGLGYGVYEREDNYLISPPLAFPKAGTYAIDTRVYANGTLDLCLGTDPSDASTFTTLLTFEEGYPDDDPTRYFIDVETPGTYYLAYHANSEESTYMGHRVYNIAVREYVAVPAGVSDFKVTPSPLDELNVALTWTYPSLTNSGVALESITKTEIYRDGELIKTLGASTPGSIGAYLDDEIPAAGTYRYKVLVYNQNGYDPDTDRNEVKSSYVGKPTAEVPYSINIQYCPEEDTDLFTTEDGNNDGAGWKYQVEYSAGQFISTLPESGVTTADDYLATPYFTLAPGYYKVNYKIGGLYQNFELGYATDRHELKTTFVKIDEVTGDTEFSPVERLYTLNIPTEGEYVFVMRHTGNNEANDYYNYLKVTGFSIESSLLLPETAQNLHVSGDTERAVISWTNPTLDNAGEPLAEITKAVVVRNGTAIATIENTEATPLIPGEGCEYIDSDFEGSGEFTYSVEIYNSNGKSEEAAPEFTAFVGHGRDLPYSGSNFDDWKVINANNDYYQWEYDYDDNFGFSQFWNTPDDYVMTPYLNLIAGNHYTVEITASSPYDDENRLHFVTGRSYEPSALTTVGEMEITNEERPYVFYFKAVAADSASPMDETGETPDKSVTKIPDGNTVFGLHAFMEGKTILHSYSVVEDTETGLRTVAASDGLLTYRNGIATTSVPAESITAYALDGRVLASARNTDSLPLEGIRGETVVVTAVIGGRTHSLKIMLMQ